MYSISQRSMHDMMIVCYCAIASYTTRAFTSLEIKSITLDHTVDQKFFFSI
ncbi:hypothetical protein BRADI_2g13229v3 [Brachypodium distachyon]|uniref:Uncharacterized protein n=1 Tax=Brachypodium distachyon TaxID=15368 RepID=A0A2K2D8A6_BRADI|nr:hypothetical protein BRADI_2g13229v3 [Brachypodium distachyon]